MRFGENQRKKLTGLFSEVTVFLNGNEVWQAVLSWLRGTGLKIVVAAVVLFLSFRLIDFAVRRIAERARRRGADKTLCRTLAYAGKILLKLGAVTLAFAYLGVDTGAVAALLASLGVGVGLAINGALSNVAGGVLLLLTRPFRDDDYIEACGEEGTVEDIRLCTTRLRTVDNRVVYIPNGTLSSSVVVNHSEKARRRVDVTFYLAYRTDVRTAADALLSVASSQAAVLSDPPPVVDMTAESERGIELTLKAWCENRDYWDVRFALFADGKTALSDICVENPASLVRVRINKGTEGTG